MSVKLVDNWQMAWRWISVNCMMAAGALQGAWIYIPDDLRQSVPPHLIGSVTILILVLGVIGRLFRKVGKDACDLGDTQPK